MTTHLPRIKSRVSIHAHRKVLGLLDGEYASVSTGRSMELHDLREYVRGDDVRDLEWKASARSGRLLVKRFVANRKHTVLLAVTTGRSMAGVDGSGAPKRDLAVLVAGLFGWLAVRHGDVVLAAYGDEAGCHLEPASAGEVALERTLRAIHDAAASDAARSSAATLLEHLTRTVRRRTIMVLVCDEYAVDERLRKLLKRIVAQHELMVVTVGDLDPTREVERALVEVETGTQVPGWIRSDPQLVADYAATLEAEGVALRRELDRLGIAHLHVADQDSAIPGVLGLLKRHRHARRR